MATLSEQPISKSELETLIEDAEFCATFKKSNGNFIIRHAERRREYEIYARAMRQMLQATEWIYPNEFKCGLRQYSDDMHCGRCGLTYNMNAEPAPVCRMK